MSDRIYFAIAPDSPVMAVIKEAQAMQLEFQKAMCAIQKEFSGEVWTTSQVFFRGIEFRGQVPEGWRMNRSYAVPNKRTKAGKTLAARFKKLPRGVDGLMFTSMLSGAFGGEFTYHPEGKLAWSTYEKYGADYILSLPLGCARLLPGCTELKMSEYSAIRERVVA